MVHCRLCIEFGGSNRFTSAEGYTGGKKNALSQHQLSNKDHKSFVEQVATLGVVYGSVACHSGQVNAVTDDCWVLFAQLHGAALAHGQLPEGTVLSLASAPAVQPEGDGAANGA